MKNTENKDGWDWQYHETRIYPEEFIFCRRLWEKWGGTEEYRLVRTDKEPTMGEPQIDDPRYFPKIRDFPKVAPEDRDLFLRLLDVRAKESIATAISNNKPNKIGAAIVLTGCLHILYDFLMTYFHVGQ